jgi:hypothetical protein
MSSSVRKLGVVGIVVGLVLSSFGAISSLAATTTTSPRSSTNASQVEPKAGTWKTWVLTSGNQFRLAAPPDKAATQAEINQLKDLVAKRDAAALDQIAFWDTGSPAFRWNEITVNEALKNNYITSVASRVMALVNIAIYDATVAAWDSKYAHNRPRPSEVDESLTTVLANPQSPAYPSEHAVAAGAASGVLAYLFPNAADTFMDMAEQAGQSRLLAGVDYPSDVTAGLELGRKVAERVVAWAKADGSDAKWTGSVPTEKGKWNGTDPVLPTMGNWKTWVLKSSNEFRPGPPPAYDSAEMKAELAEVVDFKRTPKTSADAFFWEYAVGGRRNFSYWNELQSKMIWEYRLDGNAPRAARAYALASIATYEACVACWDAKYTYWAIRPFQLDPNFKPLFNTPNHPAYPSAHGCLSGATATTMAYLFPRDAKMLNGLAEQAGESRLWAGIHFRSDITAGLKLGRQVGQVVIDRAKSDGS